MARKDYKDDYSRIARYLIKERHERANSRFNDTIYTEVPAMTRRYGYNNLMPRFRTTPPRSAQELRDMEKRRRRYLA